MCNGIFQIVQRVGKKNFFEPKKPWKHFLILYYMLAFLWFALSAKKQNA